MNMSGMTAVMGTVILVAAANVQAAGIADMFQAYGERVLGEMDEADVGKGGNDIRDNVDTTKFKCCPCRIISSNFSLIDFNASRISGTTIKGNLNGSCGSAIYVGSSAMKDLQVKGNVYFNSATDNITAKCLSYVKRGSLSINGSTNGCHLPISRTNRVYNINASWLSSVSMSGVRK